MWDIMRRVFDTSKPENNIEYGIEIMMNNYNSRLVSGRWLSALLSASLLSLSFSLYADTSWPTADDVEAGNFSAEGIERLNAAMHDIVAQQDVAGMVWLLAKDGKVATFEAAGVQSVDTGAPMTRDSLFRIYSMTKPVTGVAMMILHEQGLWEFDDPVSKHVPELANLRVLTEYDDEGNVTTVEPSREPTMRELMNHSAGFGYGLGGSDPVNNAFRENNVLASEDLDELIEKVKDIPLLFEPGDEWFYSVAVDIQGYIVQQLSGLRFGEFLEQRVFAPLGMADTSFYVRPDDVPRFAEVHNWDSERNRLVQRPHRTDRPSYLDPTRIESGGGGLVSSTHDYARFLEMLVNEGQLDGERIITPESVRIMRTNSLKDELLVGGNSERAGQAGVGFGVDFAVIFDPEAANSPHGAGTYYWSGAAGTWFWVDPANDMFWVGMIQAQGQRRPGAVNMRNVARDIIYDSLQ